jgi:hypothetical protein
MEGGCGDRHLFDFVITHEGRIFRSWLTMFIDMRSRKITGKFVAWFNSQWNHSGQGMDGRTPGDVFTCNLEVKREMPEAMCKAVFPATVFPLL